MRWPGRFPGRRFTMDLLEVFLKKSRAYIGFIGPGLVLYTVFMIAPILFAIYMSFFNWAGVGPMLPVGLDNYRKLLFSARESRIFFNALGNNFKYMATVLLLIMPIQIFFAYVLYIRIKAHQYIQFMLFLPYVISTSIIAFFATMVFDPNIGMLNTLFSQLGLDHWRSAWLGDPRLSFKIFVAVVIWAFIGNGMMIFNANMKEIVTDIIEAARIDGAGELSMFFKVVLPQIGNSLNTVLTLSIIYALTMFDLPFLLGGVQGGVNNTLDFVQMVFYRKAFGGTYFGETSLGYGSAISVTMLVIILACSMLLKMILHIVERRQEGGGI